MYKIRRWFRKDDFGRPYKWKGYTYKEHPCHPEHEFPSAYYPDTGSYQRKKSDVSDRRYYRKTLDKYNKTDTSEEQQTETDYATEEKGYRLQGSSIDSREYSRYSDSESVGKKKRRNKRRN